MTQFNLGYKVTAKDDTRSTLASALSGVTRFARLASKPITIPLRVGRKSLSLLRDVNLGLRPLVSAIDNVIDRGARLEVVSKSFQSLTGKNAAQARRLAKELVVAASGTIKLSKAMVIANRALGAGISISQLTTAIEFISKKAITTGKNAEQALEKVITGLSRGSTLFLDDFGILLDGIDGVRRAFDQVKGAGAFDSLGPAAQKAELIRQAIAEMSGQMVKIGVTGKETIFLFQGLKNAIGDSVDKLVGAVAGSKALKEALQGVRDTLDGITNFLEGGGSIFDVLFGKEGGKSGGIFGIIKAGFLDIAEEFGRAFLGGILKAIVGLKSIITQISPFAGVIDKFNKIKSAVAGKVGSLSGSKAPIDIASIVKQGRPSVLTTAGQGVTPLDPGGLLLEGAKAAGANLKSVVVKEVKLAGGTAAVAGASRLLAKNLSKTIAENAATEVRLARGAKLAGQFATAAPVGAPALQSGALAAAGFVGKKLVPAAIIADFAFTLFKFVRELKGLFGALRDVKDAQEGEKFAQSRLERTRRDKAGRGRSGNELIDKLQEEPKGIFDQLDALAGTLFAGRKGPSRLSIERDNFRQDFPGPESEPKPLTLDLIPATLTDRGRRIQKRKLNLLNRELRGINRETGVITRQARRDAISQSGEEVRSQRGLGEKIDRRQLERQIFERLVRERTAKKRERIGEIDKEISSTVTRPKQKTEGPVPTALKEIMNANKQAVDRIEQAIEKVTDSMNAGIAAIAGTERKIATAGGRRT